MIIWMKVTNDEYELPVVVANSRAELARKLGIKPNTIATAIHRAKKDGSRQQFVKVVIDDDE